jgi:hypothetical protein
MKETRRYLKRKSTVYVEVADNDVNCTCIDTKETLRGMLGVSQADLKTAKVAKPNASGTAVAKEEKHSKKSEKKGKRKEEENRKKSTSVGASKKRDVTCTDSLLQNGLSSTRGLSEHASKKRKGGN